MKDEELNISLIQYEIAWEDPRENLKKLDKLFQKISDETDLILLPETFTTGFTMNSRKLAMEKDNFVTEWMKEQAIAKNAAIAGSLIIREEEKIYNQMVFVTPGSSYSYNKRHLFRMGKENEYFDSGNERVIIEFKGWRILPLICYDLRFPVWSRNRNEYDLLIYSANWPAARQGVWNTLLKARAIENQVYVAGINRVGTDGMKIVYKGECQINDAKGESLAISSTDKEEIISCQLSLNELNAFREKFPVARDADDFRLII